MKKSDFYFELDKSLIAQDPLDKRSDSKLLVMDRLSGALKDDFFYNITDYLKSGDILVINNTKVIPARLIGVKSDSGAKIEVLLLKRLTDTDWECLVKPGKKARIGAEIEFGENLLKGEIVDILDDGNRIIRFKFKGIFEEILDKLGEMPLPPYITHKLQDKNRYQTVYAKCDGSAAAPTAGLHFTKELLQKVKEKGVIITEVTLHVGLGTFRPVKEDNIFDHKMHSEWIEVSKETANIINTAKSENRRVIAVGTTSLRTLESAATDNGSVLPCKKETDIFIYPGYKFNVVDGIITNFHLPESTLIMLVSAFSSREKILSAYKHAVDNKYRFFSFGDAMFIS